jgi:uracil-DNA glycosylase family 4
VNARFCDNFESLNQKITGCNKCPRLVAWRKEIATIKRKSFENEEYWGKPIVGFGDKKAKIFIVGLAPAAHGGNRTGRIFTGDRSGDWLFRALYKQGFSNKPESRYKGDGLKLKNVFITAAVKCAPPLNKPEKSERENCMGYLKNEYLLLKSNIRVIIVLGSTAHHSVYKLLEISPISKFAHGAVHNLGDLYLIDSYHPSQQNTFTKKLTESMFDNVFIKAKALAKI